MEHNELIHYDTFKFQLKFSLHDDRRTKRQGDIPSVAPKKGDEEASTAARCAVTGAHAQTHYISGWRLAIARLSMSERTLGAFAMKFSEESEMVVDALTAGVSFLLSRTHLPFVHLQHPSHQHWQQERRLLFYCSNSWMYLLADSG